VITNTKSNPEGAADKAHEAYHKSSNRLEELLFPQAAREFAEKRIAQTREAYEQSNKTLEAAVQTLEKSFDAAGQGAAALSRKIIDITQQNLDSGFDLAKRLAGARTLSEILELQVAYWRKQFDALTAQAEEVRSRLFGFGAANPKTAELPEPTHHKPAKKALPRAQETQKKRPSPAVRNPATQRLKQKPDTQKLEAAPPAGPAAGPAVRPPDGTRKKGRPKDKSEKLKRPTARDSAGEGEKQKPEASRTKFKARSPSNPVASPRFRLPDERPSGTRKKATPDEDQPVLQNLPAGIKCGMLDGNAVRFTNLEAWWLVDGAWRPISPGEVLLNAAVMREARFNQLFPQVPRLPSNAFRSDRQD
jgi:phasin